MRSKPPETVIATSATDPEPDSLSGRRLIYSSRLLLLWLQNQTKQAINRDWRLPVSRALRGTETNAVRPPKGYMTRGNEAWPGAAASRPHSWPGVCGQEGLPQPPAMALP